MGYYTHLSASERDQIMALKRYGVSIPRIAEEVGRDATTIRRELKRCEGNEYNAELAHSAAQAARRGKLGPGKLEECPALKDEVDRRLRAYHSPDQIAGRLRLDFPGHPQMQASHTTIYRFAYTDLYTYGRYLRRGDPRNRKTQEDKSKYERIRGGRSIDERPVQATLKTESGHFESDTLRGAFHSPRGIATHVDRMTLMTLMAFLADRKASTYIQATRAAFRRHGLRPKTFTVDNGMEFSQHRQMEEALNARVYFAHPYCPGERGLNENTNGLIRQFLPKGCNLEDCSLQVIQAIEDLLNNRPRASRGYKTPIEIMQELNRALNP